MYAGQPLAGNQTDTLGQCRGEGCPVWMVSSQIGEDTDARYYVFVAIRQSLMIMSKVLLRVEIKQIAMSGGHTIQNNDPAAAVPVLKQLYR